MNKTLIGKNNYLFLINDSCRELEVHCNNLLLVQDIKLSHLKIFDNYMIIIFPNKSLYYKKFLPDEYIITYRPALDIYKNILKNKVLDCYEFLNTVEDAYYKTDTHINLKGNYIVYLEFIKKLNKDFNLNIPIKHIHINVINNIELYPLNCGIGDLTWVSNLGEQILTDKTDNYYYSDGIEF